MPEKTYSFDESTQTLTVYSNTGVHDFCINTGIDTKDFNYPTIIDKSVTDCTFMFEHCKSFNQPISIPDSVTICRNMFRDCKSFNQPVTIPNSATDCFGVFRDCEAFNQPIILPNSVTDCSGMFYGCKSFNQPITIPDSVTDCSWMFTGSESLNKPITIPNSVSKRDGMLLFCSLMNEDGTPKSTTGSYTLSSLQHDVPTLLKVMERHLTDYVDWFNTKFPNGESSAEEVLAKLKEE